jgi:hypothetical protein
MNLPSQLLLPAKTEDLERLARFLHLDVAKAPRRPALKRQWLIRHISAITDPKVSRFTHYLFG